jgi:nucleotide-binding universal stress UspA family protein
MSIGADYFQDARVLVTVDLSNPGWENLEPVELLSSVDVLLLGLYQITDQVSPEQAREQFQEEAEQNIEELRERFNQFGVDVETRLVFCVNFAEAIDRVADEENCNAILTWNEKISFSRIGVFVRAEDRSSHLMDSVASLMADQEQTISLIHYIQEDSEEIERERRTVLENDKEYLVDRGIDQDQVEIILETVDDVNEKMVEVLNSYDAIVMGETEPTVASRIFGTRHELIQENTAGPILIVRGSHED